MNETMFVALGLAAGALSGLIGIGGGVIIVPALVFLFHFTQHRAEGTTLAMLIPPVGLLAVMPYYRNGYVDIRVAGLICLGFVFGGWAGGHFANSLSTTTLQRVFGVTLLMIGARMLWAR
jgi:uncharacterized membrane protein YfcA